jgi:phosphate transport system protein
MSIHLNRQIERIKKLILKISAIVEESFEKSIRALESGDIALAEQVIRNDREIDMKEVELEEECLATLALYQPVAHDLRYIVATLQINRDLERIGDMAVNIAEQTVALKREPRIDIEEFGLLDMARKARRMLQESLDALVDLDLQLAQSVCRMDDEVDEINRNMYVKAERRLRTEPMQFPLYFRLLVVAKQIERVADHAVNIAEDVIYLVKGEIVRHTADVADSEQSRQGNAPLADEK